MKFWAWGAMVVAVGAMGSMLGACGGSGTTGGGGAGGAGGSGVASSSAKASSSKSSSAAPSSSSGMPAKGSECMALGNMCAQCCQMDFMMENSVLFGTYVLPKCACDKPDGGLPDGGTGPICAMDCAASGCMMMPLDQTCVDCINKKVIQAMPQGQCFKDSLAACMADPMCKPLIDCVNTYCM